MNRPNSNPSHLILESLDDLGTGDGFLHRECGLGVGGARGVRENDLENIDYCLCIFDKYC